MNENLNINNMWAQLPPEMQAQMMQMMMSMMQQATEPEMKKEKIMTPEGVEIEVYDTDSYYEFFNEGKIGCVTKREQFYDEKLYTTLYNLTCGDIRRNNVIALLESKAKELGGTALVQHFKKNCVAAKKEAKEKKKKEEEQAKQARAAQEQAERDRELEEGNMTQFTNLPEWCTGNKYVGPGWIGTDRDGVYMYEECGRTTKTIVACGRPVLINRILEPIDGGDGIDRIEIAYDSERGWRRRIVERGELTNQNRAIKLAEYSVDINSERVRPFTNLMSSMLKESSIRGVIPTIKSSKKIAIFKDEKIMLPYADKDYVFEKDAQFPRLIDALTPHGSEEASIQGFVDLRRKKTFRNFNFIIAATLAAPIVMMTHSNGFVFNYYATTGSGKSLVQCIAATIWGSSDMDRGFVRGADNTQTALETVADIMNCLPVIIDDYNKLQSEEKKKRFNETIMLLASGVGKGRATKDLNIRETATYDLDVVVTAEQPIGEIAARTGAGGGVLNRLYECPADDICPLTKNQINEIMETFNNNYGHIGIKFVNILNEIGPKKLKKMVAKKARELESRMAELQADKTNKQIDTAAILLVADEIAAEQIFKDETKISLDEAIYYMTSNDVVRQEARMYQAVIDKIYTNPRKFEGLCADCMLDSNIWGKYEKMDDKVPEVSGVDESGKEFRCHPTTVAFFRRELDNIARECNSSVNMFIAYLRREGLLYADEGRNDTRVKFSAYNKNITDREEDKGTRLRVIKFRLPQQDDLPDFDKK